MARSMTVSVHYTVSAQNHQLLICFYPACSHPIILLLCRINNLYVYTHIQIGMNYHS